MTEIVERLERQAVNVENDGHVSAARAMRDAATALTEARAEIERLRANVTRLTANPADHRYWEGRWRDADRELSTLRARVREVVGPFAKAGELFAPRLPDEYDQCIYSPAAGDEYSLCGDHLRAARQLMEEVK